MQYLRFFAPAMKDWIKHQYFKYKDFFPADLWAILLMILLLVLGMIFIL